MNKSEITSPNDIIHQGDFQHPVENEKPEPYPYSLNNIELQEAIHEQLKKLGFSMNGEGYVIEGRLTKQRIRDLHSRKRIEVLQNNKAFVEQYGPDLVMNFATGRQIDPEAISPELIEVKSDSQDSRLFRFACLLWSVPVSQGFGRRIRFLVRDKQHGKLIGLFALGDPVFNLSARDKWIGWTFEDRKDRLIHVMDAYVVGSVPPYSQLIGGKLVAALMGSKEVKEVYDRKYLGRQAVISGKENRARLVLLTTTSAMGRSSLYNRLAIPNGPQFIRIGETRGFGHFHLSGEIFEQMRSYLEAIGHPYVNRGRGPRSKGYGFGTRFERTRSHIGRGARGSAPEDGELSITALAKRISAQSLPS